MLHIYCTTAQAMEVPFRELLEDSIPVHKGQAWHVSKENCIKWCQEFWKVSAHDSPLI